MQNVKWLGFKHHSNILLVLLNRVFWTINTNSFIWFLISIFIIWLLLHRSKNMELNRILQIDFYWNFRIFLRLSNQLNCKFFNHMNFQQIFQFCFCFFEWIESDEFWKFQFDSIPKFSHAQAFECTVNTLLLRWC